jgi:hypothetical protein
MKHAILGVALSLSVFGAAIGAPPDGPQPANPAPLQTPQPSLPSNDQQTSGAYYRSRVSVRSAPWAEFARPG